jgi:hypothetical protein
LYLGGEWYSDHQLRHTDHRRERRSDLVRHEREEVSFGPYGLFQFLLELHVFGDVDTRPHKAFESAAGRAEIGNAVVEQPAVFSVVPLKAISDQIMLGTSTNVKNVLITL